MQEVEREREHTVMKGRTIGKKKKKKKKGDKTDEKRANKWEKGAGKHETTKIQK